MKLLKDLGALFKASRIYVGWVVDDIQRHDFRFLLSGIRSRVELESERTTYTAVYGYGLQSEVFSHATSVELESAMLGMSWGLGRHGVEEIDASNYTNGLWKAMYACGMGPHEFRRASDPVIRSFYRGYMTHEDARHLREYVPTFSKVLRDLGVSFPGPPIELDVLKDFLESHA